MTDTHNLTPVRAGFIPLVDCSILVAAKEKGFAADHGIDLQLKKETSWANIRDRMNIGLLDVAHLLAGMPIAQSLGISHISVPTIAPMILGVGGNAITVSRTLYKELSETNEDISTAKGAALALREVVERRRRENAAPLSFGQVFPFSCHNYQLRYWMASAGIHPDHDVRLVVIPPPYMVKSLAAGQVDGFCVGEPWNTQAADEGVGVILTRPADFWPQGPEKVLGMQERWAEDNSNLLEDLLRALDAAAAWCGDGSNRQELASILSKPEYLGVSQSVIEQALDGDLQFYNGRAMRAEAEHALWLYAQMVRWGQTPLEKEAEDIVCKTYRPDLLSAALGAKSVAQIAENPEPLDGVPFRSDDVPGYIASTPIKK